jgi:molybdate transport system permease protein
MGTPLVELLRVTLLVAAGATALAAPPALAAGYLLARRDFPGKSLVETFVALPLVLPPTAVGFLLLELFAWDGPLGAERLGFDLGILLTWRGAVLASAVMSFPLIARTARVAFEGVEPRLERMAESLGYPRWRVWTRVTLPLARRGVLAALALGFGRALGEFGATVVVGGNVAGRTETLALAIFNDIQAGRDARAMQLAGLTALLAFLLVFAVERLLRPRARAAADGGGEP